MNATLDLAAVNVIPWGVRLYRLGLGLLILIAVIENFRHTSVTAGNFLSFFTIQSNIFGAVILLLGATTLIAPTLRWDYVRGAAMIFLALTGVIYNLLLRGLGTETPFWIDNTLHVIAPLVMVMDFLIDPPHHRLEFVRSLWWTVYPLAYAAYSLVRGPIADWYPYSFLNPTDGGWMNVVVHVIVIAIGFVVVSRLVVSFSNWRLRHLAGEVQTGTLGV